MPRMFGLVRAVAGTVGDSFSHSLWAMVGKTWQGLSGLPELLSARVAVWVLDVRVATVRDLLTVGIGSEQNRSGLAASARTGNGENPTVKKIAHRGYQGPQCAPPI